MSESLSIVVASFSALEQLETCLESLRPAIVAGAEVVVCRADEGAELATLIAAYPDVSFVGAPVESDVFRLRTIGVEAASRGLIALTEDHVTVSEQWAAALLGGFAAGHDVVGGPVVPRTDAGLVEWAIYFCEYGRYRGPGIAGPTDALSGVNVAYRRSVLDDGRSLWKTAFYESDLHAEFAKHGSHMILVPEAQVWAALQMTLREASSHLFHGANRFGRHRGRSLSVGMVAARALAFPLTALVLWFRAARRNFSLRALLSFPVTLWLFAAWSAGEASGYLAALGDRAGENS